MLAVMLAQLLVPAYASAAGCRFVLGFATLKALIDEAEGPEKVGECLEDEHFNVINGDSLQQTTGGLMVWRKHDNWTAFTDGYRTWINGPYGLQKRLNTARFDWEEEPPPVATPEAAAAEVPRVVVPDLSLADRAALIALYNASDGASWAIKKNWLSDAPLGTWYGVHTDKRGRVTHLVLINNRLSGTIPTELGNLTNLVRVNLGWNNLSGGIPVELGTLPYLEMLKLHGNNLTGGIPSELGQVSGLKWLDLSSNALSGEIPATLGSLGALESLFLSYNRLTGQIPAELGNLSGVDYLRLSGNRLTGEIPTELAGLPALSWLYLDSNKLIGCTPVALRQLSRIETGLPFCSEATVSAPDRAGLVAADRAVLVAFYHATGGHSWRSNHKWLSDAPIGEWFGVRTNRAGRVTALALSENILNGELPPELGNLSALEALYLNENKLSGRIPPELGRLGQLYVLSLAANELRGQVPAELGRLRNLRILNVGLNRLSGSIPAELGALAKLERLVLEHNAISGGVPPELGALHRLRRLKLEGNDLTGGLPGELGRLPRLEWLQLTGNRLTGEISSELGNLRNLTRLELGGGNQLTGCLPVAAPHTDAPGLPLCAGAVDTSGGLPATQLPPPPVSLGLDGVYGKYVDAGGVPIVSSLTVPDEALLRARDILSEMLAARPELYAALVRKGTRVAIGERGGVVSDLPEFRDSGIYDDLHSKTRGIYEDELPQGGAITVAFEENILCHDGESNKGNDTLVHELAHAVEFAMPDEFMERVDSAYRQAMEAGLWRGAYAASNAREYWAEAVMGWFALRGASRIGATTRSSLWSYDPGVATLVHEVFGDAAVSASCHKEFTVEGTLVGPNGAPLAGVRLEAQDFFALEYANRGLRWIAQIDAGGNFRLTLPNGYYTIAIRQNDGTWVGYYGGGGFVQYRQYVIPFEVAGADVTGIKIVLP